MKQPDKTPSSNEVPRLLRKKITRLTGSRDSIKVKSREKSKIIKAQQDREQELIENRDHWKVRCKGQEKKNEELSRGLKKLADQLEVTEEELQQVLDECDELKKNSTRGSKKST
jgi:hypothetical protein